MKARRYKCVLVILISGLCFINSSCNKKKDTLIKNVSAVSLDSTQINFFYTRYPKLALYKKQVFSLYRTNNYDYIWYGKKGIKETADVIYNKINNLDEEGVQAKLPYKATLDYLLQNWSAVSDLDTELLLSNYYFLYVNKTMQGIDYSKTKELGWYLPRKKQSYVAYLDSLLINPKLIDNKEQHIDQYYKLKVILQKYRKIEQKGGWEHINVPSDFVSIKPGDSSLVVAKIRTRLFLTRDILEDSGKQVYDVTLQQAVLKYKKFHGFTLDKIILLKHIDEMNVTISARIKTIIVNMERCRWISTDLVKAKEFIVVNIPSYRLTYFKSGKSVLVSKVVVGTTMNKTVVFSGMMSSIVFSPYWNVTQNIIKKEILPEMEKDEDYLQKHDMEWNDGNVRQRPGPTNSLGLVKFLFPNSNNIYLHDTPSKSLFGSEKRAFSHGCIRVEKPVELANLILKDDPNWTSEKIDVAMHKGEETKYTLKNKIPVYIGYFTSFVDNEGNINFYKDIYEKDAQLATMLVEE